MAISRAQPGSAARSIFEIEDQAKPMFDLGFEGGRLMKLGDSVFAPESGISLLRYQPLKLPHGGQMRRKFTNAIQRFL